VEKPEDMEGLIQLTRVLLESEENEIRLRKVKLEERYYDFEANTMCAKELEKVRAYLRAVGDNENLSPEEKQERVIELLFGKDKVNVKDVEEAEEEERDGILTREQREAANRAGRAIQKNTPTAEHGGSGGSNGDKGEENGGNAT
jgi:hypothetical protein